MLFYGPVHLASGLFALEGVALVVEPLPFGHADLQLGFAVLKIEFGRHQSQALFLNLADQLPDFVTMQKQSAHPQRIGIFAVAELVRADMHVADEDLTVADAAVGLLEVDLAGAQRFDLRPFELESGFKNLLYKVIVKGLLVAGHKFNGHGSGSHAARRRAWPHPRE